MQIIAFAGAKGSGKDTAADCLVRMGYKRLSFADPLKEACQILFSLSPEDLHDPERKEASRELMQWLGTDCLRSRDPDIFCNLMRRRLRGETRVVIPDVRFQNEGDLVREFGGTVIRVSRAGTLPDAHASENQAVAVDLSLANSGTVAQLEGELRSLLSQNNLDK
ncbi:unnamed protein product [Chrysoparadoxa australica]